MFLLDARGSSLLIAIAEYLANQSRPLFVEGCSRRTGKPPPSLMVER